MENSVINNDTQKETISFWEFLGLIVLFAIPVIGFIACIVFMFSTKRKNMKNYARAAFTALVMKLIASFLIITLILTALGNMILPTINEAFNAQFDSAFQVIGLAKNIITKNYSATIKTLRPQLIEMLGEDFTPILDELSNDEYNDFLAKVIEEDYSGLLEDCKNGKYPNLENKLGKEDFDKFMNELKSASNGEPSELFGSLKDTLSQGNIHLI